MIRCIAAAAVIHDYLCQVRGDITLEDGTPRYLSSVQAAEILVEAMEDIGATCFQRKMVSWPFGTLGRNGYELQRHARAGRQPRLAAGIVPRRASRVGQDRPGRDFRRERRPARHLQPLAACAADRGRALRIGARPCSNFSAWMPRLSPIGTGLPVSTSRQARRSQRKRKPALSKSSANSMGFEPSLRAASRTYAGATDTQTFLDAMKSNHPLAIEYCARLVRFNTRWSGPCDRELDLPIRPAGTPWRSFRAFWLSHTPLASDENAGARAILRAGCWLLVRLLPRSWHREIERAMDAALLHRAIHEPHLPGCRVKR